MFQPSPKYPHETPFELSESARLGRCCWIGTVKVEVCGVPFALKPGL